MLRGSSMVQATKLATTGVNPHLSYNKAFIFVT